MASKQQSPRWLNRMTGVLGLFIGLFGAMAIMGVFFKIAKYPNWEILMAVGFIGEAAAFVVMGVLALLGGFLLQDAPETAAPAGKGFSGGGGPTGEVAPVAAALSSDEFRKAMAASAEDFRRETTALLREHLHADLGPALQGLMRDVAHVGQELDALGGELSHTRGAIEQMRTTLERTATGDLPASAEKLGRGMRDLAEGMAGAGDGVRHLQADLDQMSRRFFAFNHDVGSIIPPRIPDGLNASGGAPAVNSKPIASR